MEVTIDATAVQILTAITALFAVIVGPLVTVRTTNRQVRAMTVSLARRDWNDQLRNALVDYLAATRQLTSRAGPVPIPPDDFQRCMQTINSAFMRVSLLLNPAEPAHMNLLSAFNPVWESVVKIQAAALRSDYMTQWPALHGEIGARVGAVLQQARAVLKAEWEKVKKAL